MLFVLLQRRMNFLIDRDFLLGHIRSFLGQIVLEKVYIIGVMHFYRMQNGRRSLRKI